VAGDPDVRPGSWGLSKAIPVRLKITAPTGYRVRILHIAGDLVAWPKKGVLTGDRYAEVGWGLNTSGLEIHLEPTVTVTYRFEKSDPAKKP
jgi:hypothetical protein